MNGKGGTRHRGGKVLRERGRHFTGSVEGGGKKWCRSFRELLFLERTLRLPPCIEAELEAAPFPFIAHSSGEGDRHPTPLPQRSVLVGFFPHLANSLLSPFFAGLRVVHTVAESILETTNEEDRRRFKRAASRKDSNGENGIKPKRTLFGRRKRAGTVTSSRHGLEEEEQQEDPTIEVGYEERAELERMRTRANAAAEAEESARRQEKQDAEERKKKSKKTGKKEKGRRVVYVNVEGAKTDPRGYERNKVRTSKYTALSFLPKVRPFPPCLRRRKRTHFFLRCRT